MAVRRNRSIQMSLVDAAGLLALLIVVVAGVLVALASRMNVEADIAPVVEMRDMAIAELEAEVRETAQKLRGIANAVKAMQANLLGSLSVFVIPLPAMLLKKKP